MDIEMIKCRSGGATDNQTRSDVAHNDTMIMSSGLS